MSFPESLFEHLLKHDYQCRLQNHINYLGQKILKKKRKNGKDNKSCFHFKKKIKQEQGANSW